MIFRKTAVILILVLTVAVLITSLPVTKAAIIPTSMSASLSSNPISTTQTVTITGIIEPPPPNGYFYTIRVYVDDPNGNQYEIGSPTSDSNGVASMGFQPYVAGTYTIYLIFEGDQFGSDIYQDSSATLTLEVTSLPYPGDHFDISMFPLTQTVYQGESTTYEVTLSSRYEFHEVCQLDISGLPNYATSSFNPSTITPTGTSTLTVYTAATTPTGTHTLTITAASSPSDAKTIDVSLTVIQSLAVSATPASIIVNAGQSATFSVSASGGIAPYTYQWYEGTTLLTGETSYQLTVTEGVGSYSYYCRVGDAGGRTVDSNTVSLTVVPPLTASATPASATVTTWESATFSVSASGGVPPYTFQWYEEGSAMAGETSYQLTVTKSAAGSHWYNCLVQDSVYNSITSNTVYLTVVDSLAASVTPASETVVTGEQATFSVSASGGVPSYTYQWYEGTSAMSGETSNQLTVSKSTTGSYSYYCHVGDSGGRTVDSNTVSLTVVPPLTASASPASETVTTGEQATFSVSASGGEPPYTYQWYEGTTLLTGETSSQLTVTKGTVGSYSYYCSVEDSGGRTVDSNTVSLTVVDSLAASATPASDLVTVGDSATFSVSASGGEPPYTYQWYEGTSALAGKTSDQLTVTEGVGSYSYYCRITDSGARTVDSNTVSLTVVDSLTASASPASKTVVTGEQATFSVSVAGGTTPYTYQWYEEGSVMAGETSSQLTVTKGTVGSYSYYCSVEDFIGTTVNSNTVSLTVNELLTASVTPASTTVTRGQQVTFNVSASGGEPPYTYQWYEGTSAMAGQNSSQLTITTSATGSYSYYCNVTDSEGRTVNSNTVSLTVNAPSSSGGNGGTTSTSGSSGTTTTPTPTPKPTPTPAPTSSPAPTPTPSPTPTPPPTEEGISLWVVGGAVAGIGAASAVFGFMLLKRPKKPPAPSQLRITAEPANIVADGTTKSVITLQLLDKKGKPTSAPNDTQVKISTAKGKLENPTVVVPKGKDAEQTVIVSSRESGQVPVSAEADGLKSVTITLNFLEKKRYCMHCGALMSSKAKVCPNCGKAPPAGVDTKVCHNCKSVIPVVAKFCSECASGQKE